MNDQGFHNFHNRLHILEIIELQAFRWIQAWGTCTQRATFELDNSKPPSCIAKDPNSERQLVPEAPSEVSQLRVYRKLSATRKRRATTGSAKERRGEPESEDSEDSEASEGSDDTPMEVSVLGEKALCMIWVPLNPLRTL